MPTVAVGSTPKPRATTLRARDHPKTAQNRQFLIDIAAIRKRRNPSICTRSKLLIDTKSPVSQEQKRTETEIAAKAANHEAQLTTHGPSNRK